jgi:hypothetical protein
VKVREIGTCTCTYNYSDDTNNGVITLKITNIFQSVDIKTSGRDIVICKKLLFELECSTYLGVIFFSQENGYPIIQSSVSR